MEEVNEDGQVFVVSEFVEANLNSTGYYWSQIIEELGKTFGKVLVICPNNNLTEKSESSSKVKYTTFYSRPYNKCKLSSRIWGQLRQSANFSLKILKEVSRKDVVCTGTNPALLLIFMLFVKKIKGFKWVVLVYDVFPENLIPAKILSLKSLRYKLLSLLFNWVYSSADKLIVIGRDMEEIMQKKIDRKDKIVFMPNWCAPDDVTPISREESPYLKQFGWQENVVFLFFGNIGRLQGISNLLRAIKLVTHPKAAFLFLGGGQKVDEINSFINNNADLPVKYAGKVSFENRNMALSSCDVAIVSLSSGMAGLGVPSKAYFSLAADKPFLLVSDKNAELARVVSEEDIGWFCEPSNPKKLALLIDELCDLDFSAMHGLQRSLLLKKYSGSLSLKIFSNCVSELML